MRLNIITVSQKIPEWVSEGFQDYHKRFPREFPCSLTEIPLSKRNKSDSTERIKQLVIEEGVKIQNVIPKGSKTIALEVKGKPWTSEQLAVHLANFQQETATLNFLIGGPDGLSKECLAAAESHWSLSALTLPHALVRIILVEQLYRAVCILQRHPYHRG